MVNSTVVDSSTGKSVPSNVRTSSGTFLGKSQDDIVGRIEKRVAQVTMIPVGEDHFDYTSIVVKRIGPLFRNQNNLKGNNLKDSMLHNSHICFSLYVDHQEGFQILHYEHGQKYEPVSPTDSSQ